MFKINLLNLSVTLLILITIQKCSSELTWNLPSDLIDDAHEQLEKFMQVTNNSLVKALDQYRNVSKEVDSAALSTKGAGVIRIQEISQKFISDIFKNNTQDDKKCEKLREAKMLDLARTATDDLINCVDKIVNDTLNFIPSAIIKLLAFAVDQNNGELKSVISCGRIDEKCLNKTVASIKTNKALMPGAIRSLALIDEMDVEDQISLIKKCGKAVISKIEYFGKELFSNIIVCRLLLPEFVIILSEK